MGNRLRDVSLYQYQTIRVTPLSAAAGADLDVGDVRKLSSVQTAEIRRAWLEHHVVRFRGQHLDDAELSTFGRRFGQFQISNPLPSPDAHENSDIPGRTKRAEQAPRDESYPQITVVSNIIENGVAIGGLGDGELVWHSDMSSFEIPPAGTALFGVEVPEGQGRTAFLNAHLAYETLPPVLRERADGLQLKHNGNRDATGFWRPVKDVRTSPGRVHPLVVTHPETGRNALFLGRRPFSYIVGLSVDESESLLDELWAHATGHEQFIWRQDWRSGDLIMWDNRSVLH